MNAAYPLAFLVGLLSTLHCLGMCGGIIGAMSWSLPAAIRADPVRHALRLLAFNLGRIGSYAVAGALFGWIGAGLIRAADPLWIDDLLRLLAACLLIAIGLYIAGWLPGLAAIERLGLPIWRRLEPIGRRLLPVKSLPGALLFGAVWGWLPCGLVYSMLIGAPVQDCALPGALYMASFGAGTLPLTLATSLLAGRLHRWGKDRRIQAVSGILLVVLALLTLGYQGYNAADAASS